MNLDFIRVAHGQSFRLRRGRPERGKSVGKSQSSWDYNIPSIKFSFWLRSMTKKEKRRKNKKKKKKSPGYLPGLCAR